MFSSAFLIIRIRSESTNRYASSISSSVTRVFLHQSWHDQTSPYNRTEPYLFSLRYRIQNFQNALFIFPHIDSGFSLTDPPEDSVWWSDLNAVFSSEFILSLMDYLYQWICVNVITCARKAHQSSLIRSFPGAY